MIERRAHTEASMSHSLSEQVTRRFDRSEKPWTHADPRHETTERQKLCDRRWWLLQSTHANNFRPWYPPCGRLLRDKAGNTLRATLSKRLMCTREKTKSQLATGVTTPATRCACKRDCSHPETFNLTSTMPAALERHPSKVQPETEVTTAMMKGMTRSKLLMS